MCKAKSGCYKNEDYVKHEYKCEFCNKIFNTYKHAFTYHVNRCTCNPNSDSYKRKHIIQCARCGKSFSIECSDKDFENANYSKYCSLKCSNTRVHTEESRHKVSSSLHAYYGTEPHATQYCILCNNELSKNNSSGYCINCIRTHNKEFREQFPLSDDVKSKLSAAGRKGISTQAEIRRSKNETAFCNLCEQHFSNVEHNVPIFNGWDADVIIHDIKYAVLWNGKWHYEKITADHSVEQVQNRDRIKINEIIKFGYTPYIIKDVGKHKESFVREEFDKFIKLVSIMGN